MPQSARVALAAAIARAYFDLQRLFAQRDVSRAAITQREDIVRITAERFTAGLDTKVEVRQAEAALATVRTELAQYDEAIGVARNQLAALVGAGPGAGRDHRRGEARGARPRRPARRDPARPRRPGGRRSSHRAGASRPRARTSTSRKAQFYPERQPRRVRGALLARLLELPHCGGSSIVGVGPAIHLPIFEGGRLNANLRASDADANLAVGDATTRR